MVLFCQIFSLPLFSTPLSFLKKNSSESLSEQNPEKNNPSSSDLKANNLQRAQNYTPPSQPQSFWQEVYDFLTIYKKRLLYFFPKGPQTSLPPFRPNVSPVFLGKHLWSLGYMPKNWVYSENICPFLLARALRNFQKAHGLPITGKLDEETLEILNEPLSWIFEDLDHTLAQWEKLRHCESFYIVVNIPSYTLWALRDGKIILESPVVVGKAFNKSMRTPLFSGEISSVVTWPLWIVPTSIAQSKGLSAKNPGYFFQGGRLVRRAGPGNALGCIKFQTNKGGFLLHYTNQPHLFQEKQRDFSSGCVRVQNYESLLKILPINQIEKALDALENNQTKSFTLYHPVPLFCVYLTALPPKKTDDFFGPYRHEDIYGEL